MSLYQQFRLPKIENPLTTCMHCKGTTTNFRVRTRDLKCKTCGGITPLPRENLVGISYEGKLFTEEEPRVVF